MKRRFIKFISNKAYLAFFLMMPLLAGTSLAKLECPVCDGTGVLNSTPGMEKVELVSYDPQQIMVARDVCAQYVIYLYDITLKLNNDGTDATSGYARAILKDYVLGKVIDTQYLPIEIDGESMIESRYEIGFQALLDEPKRAIVEVTLLDGSIPDTICDGTGKISLNAWLLADRFKESYQEISRVEHKFVPMPYLPPDIEDVESFWMMPPDSELYGGE